MKWATPRSARSGRLARPDNEEKLLRKRSERETGKRVVQVAPSDWLEEHGLASRQIFTVLDMFGGPPTLP